MINNFLVYVLVFLIAVGAQPAFAQCDVHYEAIVKLRSANLGSYNIWDSIHGELEYEEQFRSGVVMDNGNVLIAGQRHKMDTEGPFELVITEIGRNGRVLWEKVHPVSGLQQVIKILPHGKGYLVLGDRKPEKKNTGVWLGFVNAQGSLLSQKNITRGGADLSATDILSVDNGKSMILSAFIEKKDKSQLPSAILYRLSAKGHVISDQAFVIGSENKISGISPRQGSGFIATGYIYGVDGRKNGWIMTLDENLKMDWQKPYPRGSGAELVRGIAMLDDFIVAVGTALPVREGTAGGWVMVVDLDNGNIGWQRYFTGDLNFVGRDLLVNEDGMISVILDGQMPGETKRELVLPDGSKLLEHIRLLTINPRGILFLSDEYFNGQAVDAHQMVLGKNTERIIVGQSTMAYKIEAQGDQPEKTHVTDEGWVVAATPVDPYDDPCLPSKEQRELPE